jgi:hypothetical protein
MSAYDPKADIELGRVRCPLMTQSRHSRRKAFTSAFDPYSIQLGFNKRKGHPSLTSRVEQFKGAGQAVDPFLYSLSPKAARFSGVLRQIIAFLSKTLCN